MYPTQPSDNIGVMLDDPKFKLGKRIREALKAGDKLYLVKKKKYIVDTKRYCGLTVK